MDIQVLCPMKKGVIGVENMNDTLQEALNPAARGKAELKVGMHTFRTGDKVMHTVNNYDLEWTDEEGGAGSGVFNGDIGREQARECSTATSVASNRSTPSPRP